MQNRFLVAVCCSSTAHETLFRAWHASLRSCSTSSVPRTKISVEWIFIPLLPDDSLPPLPLAALFST